VASSWFLFFGYSGKPLFNMPH